MALTVLHVPSSLDSRSARPEEGLSHAIPEAKPANRPCTLYIRWVRAARHEEGSHFRLIDVCITQP